MISHYDGICHAQFSCIAEFISFSCKLQPICSERASAALYVCIILLHNTYIHTYIPPLGGVCMYVCMYVLYSLQMYLLHNTYNSV